MRIFTRMALASLLVLPLFGGVASAEPVWCEEDPVFVFNGKAVDVVTGFSGEWTSSARVIVFELELPANAGTAVSIGAAVQVPQDTRISYTLAPWTGGPVPAVVHVTVVAGADFDTRTRVTGTAEGLFFVYGRSNQRLDIPLRFLVD